MCRAFIFLATLPFMSFWLSGIVCDIAILCATTQLRTAALPLFLSAPFLVMCVDPEQLVSGSCSYGAHRASRLLVSFSFSHFVGGFNNLNARIATIIAYDFPSCSKSMLEHQERMKRKESTLLEINTRKPCVFIVSWEKSPVVLLVSTNSPRFKYGGRALHPSFSHGFSRRSQGIERVGLMNLMNLKP